MDSLNIIERLHKHKKSYSGCGVLNVIAIDIMGNLYPCQGLMGFDDFIIGNINDGFDNEAIEKFNELYSNYLKRCDNCWARNLCRASCIAMSIQYNEMDERFEPSRWCDSYKKEIESSIYFYNMILQKNPQLFKEKNFIET